MKGKSVLVVLALLLLVVMLHFHGVDAAGPAIGHYVEDIGLASNIQPVEDFWPNLTLPRYGIKHKFPADYLGGSLEFYYGEPLEAAPSNVTEDVDQVVLTVPEFQAALVLPIFLALTLLGVAAGKVYALSHKRCS